MIAQHFGALTPSTSTTAESSPKSRPTLAIPTFERALAAEIVASEQARVRTLAGALAVLLGIVEALLFIFQEDAQRLARRPVPLWLPLAVLGPFAAYEFGASLVLERFRRRGRPVFTALRFVNATIETSLPSVVTWTGAKYWPAAAALGAWPSLLYFVFIVASTLRLGFWLPVFTGAVSAVGYMLVVSLLVPLSTTPDDPLTFPVYHVIKAGIMLIAGVVAGLVAMRLRRTFRRAVDEGAARERVTNLFGQHLSPAVVERLLGQPTDLAGETRDICVMFLDIRDFTAQARQRRPPEVVDFLNDAFAFMIEAVDRHGGFINKFLGDGFMAVFGAPLVDPDASRNAVAAAREILAEIDGRGLARAPWPLRIGIGLHAGPAVIGTVGSPRRKEFTAIGDTVNLAARLEQLNKQLGSQLLVSDAVAAALDEDVWRGDAGRRARGQRIRPPRPRVAPVLGAALADDRPLARMEHARALTLCSLPSAARRRRAARASV
jgi:adenylate cyclase